MIALGLIVTGLYFLWWGIYAVLVGIAWNWEPFGFADYADMMFAFAAGFIVLVAGLVSLTQR